MAWLQRSGRRCVLLSRRCDAVDRPCARGRPGRTGHFNVSLQNLAELVAASNGAKRAVVGRKGFALAKYVAAGFAREMENTTGAVGKPREKLIPSMTWSDIALLLSPCILFMWMAGYAVIYGNQYADMPQEKYVLERHRKDAELRQIVASNIAAGDPIPRRETMLKELDVRDERAKSWEDALIACAQSMRKMGFGVLFGIGAQFYVVFRLRAHYRKLQREGSVPSQNSINL